MGVALTNKTLNTWGVKNILRSVLGEFGEVKINWVQENTFIIIVKDEKMANRILEHVPWAVMCQNFSVKRWPQELVLEEVMLRMVHFWIQMKGAPLHPSKEANAMKLVSHVREVIEIEDLSFARGFPRVRVMVTLIALLSVDVGCRILGIKSIGLNLGMNDSKIFAIGAVGSVMS